MGIFLSWASFRMYHLPIRRGAGWSWGARSPSKAWGVGVSGAGYAEDGNSEATTRDLEEGNNARSARLLRTSQS